MGVNIRIGKWSFLAAAAITCFACESSFAQVIIYGPPTFVQPAPIWLQPTWVPVAPMWTPLQPANPQPQAQGQIPSAQNDSSVTRNYPENESKPRTVIIERYYLDADSVGKPIKHMAEQRTEYAVQNAYIYREYYLPQQAKVPASSTDQNNGSLENEKMKTLKKESDDPDLAPAPTRRPKSLDLSKKIEQAEPPKGSPSDAPAKMEPAKRYD